MPDAGQRGEARRGEHRLVDRRVRVFFEESEQPAGGDPRVPLRVFPRDEDRELDGKIRVQWCHGAPDIVASLTGFASDNDEHDRLLRSGGELTWPAGPLAKGSGLCHGTAGNGYAFLALLERTGDDLWLERARAFAMHAATQVARARETYGRGRFTLWTGDPGAALYLADCLAGRGALPVP